MQADLSGKSERRTNMEHAIGASVRTSIAYLVNRYPEVSHTFIRREIQALERLGIEVLRFSLRGPSGRLVDPVDIHEQTSTRYVVPTGLLALGVNLLRTTVSSPRRVWRAAILASRMARGSDRSWLRHMAYLSEAAMILRWLKNSNVQHLHAHFATNPAEIAMLVHALGGPNYSFTAHGSDINNRPAQLGLPMLVGGASFVAAVCAFGRSQICKWVSDEFWHKVHVVRCGIESGYGSSSATAESSQSSSLVCIGRLSVPKGQMILLEAVALLRDEGRDFNVVLVGDGPMRPRIEARISELGIGHHVTLVGAQDGAGVQAQMLNARALVVPSLSEGLPVVIMEAMALRRPVIAPYLAGIPELVRDGRNGWLYPAADVSALSQRMAQCLDAEPDLLRSMGDAARIDVLEAHDVDREAARLTAFFALPAPQQGKATSRS